MVSGNGHRPPGAGRTPRARRVRFAAIVVILIAVGAVAFGGYLLLRGDDPDAGARAWTSSVAAQISPATSPSGGRVGS